MSDAQMPERESRLWLRAALLLVLAPGLLIIVAYVAAPWVAPQLAERGRENAAVGIGLGAWMLFTGIFGFGALRFSDDTGRGSRITVQGILVSWIAIGTSAILLTLARSGSLLAWTGLALLIGGIAIKLATYLAPIFRRLGRRRQTHG